MYVYLFILVFTLSQIFTNKGLGIDSENVNSYSFNRNESLIILGIFFLGVLLSIFNITFWVLVIIYMLSTMIGSVLIMANRKKRVEKLKEETELIYGILKKLVDKNGKSLDFNNIPFELHYKYGNINQIDITVEPTTFDEKQLPIYIDQLNSFLSEYTWQYETKLARRTVSFVGRDKPPKSIRWVGSWLQSYKFFPLGVSGRGEIGLRLENISEKKLNVSQTLDSYGNPMKIDVGMSYQPHSLVVGATGGGKSVTIQNSIMHAIEHRNKVATLLLDPKFVEFDNYRDMNGILGVACTAKEIVEVLRIARLVMYKRNQEMAKLGIKNIHDYKPKNRTDKIFVSGVDMQEYEKLLVKNGNEVQETTALDLLNKVQEIEYVEISLTNGEHWVTVNKHCVQEIYLDEMPFLYIVCDELAELTTKDGGKSEKAKEEDGYKDEILNIINSIAQLGRSAGIMLVVATQRGNATVVPTILRSNLGTRMFCGRATESGASMVALDNTLATTIDNEFPGAGIFQVDGASNARFVRFYYSKFEDLEEYYTVRGLDSKGYRKGVNSNQEEVFEDLSGSVDIIKQDKKLEVSIDKENVVVDQRREQDWSEV